MAKSIEWLEDNRIKVLPPSKPKKITGTRFGSILGVNVWSTEFEIWSAITRTYEEPFEDTIYTIAGKTIEPKQAEYMTKSYGMDIITPTDVYGKDYFNKTFGDFFPNNKIFGGMWDYLSIDEDNHVDAVLEMKTTKRVEDWSEDIPEYYALQGALYAYLLGVDQVYMVASFLEDSDYEKPEQYKPTAKNTIIRDFKVSERYPNMSELIAYCEDWWKNHVLTGVSPAYDATKDKKIIDEIKKSTIDISSDLETLISQAEKLQEKLDAVDSSVADEKKQLAQLKDRIKEIMTENMSTANLDKLNLSGSIYSYTLSKSERTEIDKKALEKDNLLDKYAKTKTTYTLTSKILGGK